MRWNRGRRTTPPPRKGCFPRQLSSRSKNSASWSWSVSEQVCLRLQPPRQEIGMEIRDCSPALKKKGAVSPSHPTADFILLRSLVSSVRRTFGSAKAELKTCDQVFLDEVSSGQRRSHFPKSNVMVRLRRGSRLRRQSFGRKIEFVSYLVPGGAETSSRARHAEQKPRSIALSDVNRIVPVHMARSSSSISTSRSMIFLAGSATARRQAPTEVRCTWSDSKRRCRWVRRGSTRAA